MRDDRQLSQDQEKRLAKKVNGKVQPGSGSSWRKPNDVSSADHLYEAKRTRNVKQITVRVEDLEKVRRNALLAGKTPVFHIEIGKRRYIIMEEHDYLAMLEER